jgi:RNA polymerase sigma-70 factor (ECF subfamily)
VQRSERNNKVQEAKEIVKRYTPFAYSVAFRLTGNSGAAWDLTQNAMLRVLKSWSTYDPSYKVEQWLYRIVRNLFIDRIRKEKRRREDPLERTADEERRSLAETLVDPALTPDQILDRDNRRTAVQAALARLPDDMCLAVTLVDIKGCSYEEASKIMEIPASTLGVRVYRGRKRLKEILKGFVES